MSNPTSLLDHVAANNGSLPDELSQAMRQSSREAFQRRKAMSTEDDAIIQAVAQALRTSRVGWDTSGMEPETEDVADAKEAIAAYLDGLEKAGLCVAPKAANVSMLADATLLDDEPNADDQRRAAMAVDSYPKASSRVLRADVIAAVAMMARDYRVMISASPTPPGAEP